MRTRCRAAGLGLSCLLVLALAVPASAQVVFDAVGTASSCTSCTTLNNTSLTVGSGSNRALIAQLSFCSVSCGGTAVTNVTVNWDNTGTPQAMTQIVTTTSVNGQKVFLFGLVAPTSGNKTLNVSWTNATEAVVNIVSYTGVNQTGGATSFPNSTSLTGNSASASVTVTSATNDAVLSTCSCGNVAAINSINQTQTYLYHGVGSFESAGNRAAGAATVTDTCTLASTDQWAIVGTDVAQASGASPTCARTLLGVGC